MNEKGRVAFLTACLFVIGLHLRTAGRLIVEGWVGPYADSGPAEPLARGPSDDALPEEVLSSTSIARGAGGTSSREGLGSGALSRNERH